MRVCSSHAIGQTDDHTTADAAFIGQAVNWALIGGLNQLRIFMCLYVYLRHKRVLRLTVKCIYFIQRHYLNMSVYISNLCGC